MKLNAILLPLCVSLCAACGADKNNNLDLPSDPSLAAIDQEEEDCPNCTEEELNAPVAGTESELSLNDDELDAFNSVQATPQHRLQFPAFNPSWKLSEAKYNKAKLFYNNSNTIRNRRYVVIIDFSKRSTEKRLYLFDLADGSVDRYMAAHGKGSDQNADGIAEKFSNVPRAKASSLGYYVTKGTYIGKHGKSLVLSGLSKTNSNAESRRVVFHAAKYMNEKSRRAGRSWGCPAMDPAVYTPVMNKIKGGALVMMDK